MLEWLEDCLYNGMQPYELDTKIGHVKIVNVCGGKDKYEVFVNDSYQGNVVRSNGRWVGHLINNSELAIDEVMILGEIIEKNLVPGDM